MCVIIRGWGTPRGKPSPLGSLRSGARVSDGAEWSDPDTTRRVNTMSIKLTDAQLVILSTAAQREDRCLTMPQNLKGGAAQKVSSKLLAAALVREIRRKPGAPVWGRDEEAETSYSLKLTAAGMKAIAVDENDDQPVTSRAATANPNPSA